ncbi:MAG: hypothetical protein ACF8XB_07380 [Planctomycetota bacterium JB042]
MSIPSINSMLAATLKAKYRERIDEAWTQMIAAQGTSDTMKKHLKRYDEITGQKKSGSARDFVARFGGGF